MVALAVAAAAAGRGPNAHDRAYRPVPVGKPVACEALPDFCKVVSFIVFRLSRAQMAATDADGPSVRPLARGRLAT